MWKVGLLALVVLGACGGKAKNNHEGVAGMSDGDSAGAPSTSRPDPVLPRECDDGGGCEGHPCVEIYPGHKTCIIAGGEATECFSELDECCSSSECAEGRCYQTRFPQSDHCHDYTSHQACVSDECSGDSCGSGRACMPAGVLGPVAMCTNAVCQTDADCNAEPGGSCLLIADSCCNGRYLGLLCWYPKRGCAWNTDCKLGDYCGVAANGTDTECRLRSSVCP
jgi:hypothetical protein